MVSKDWAEYAVPFQVTGKGCDAANNRLSIEAGQIGGKLWMANFSVVPGSRGPVVRIDPQSPKVAAGGASGRLSVTASSGYRWSISQVPDGSKSLPLSRAPEMERYPTRWMKTKPSKWSATLILRCDHRNVAVSSVRHPTSLPRRLPLQYSSCSLALARKGTDIESSTRWMIDEQPGQHSVLTIAAEAPKGGNSVLIEKQADPRPWATQVILPSIGVKVGETYKVSIWMKAQKPGPVSIAFDQRTQPYGPCGLLHTFTVSKDWAEYAVPVRVTGKGCDVANNRLSIEAGQIGGKLWMANFSVVPGSRGSAGESTRKSPKVAAGGASGRLSVTANSGTAGPSGKCRVGSKSLLRCAGLRKWNGILHGG